MRPLWSSFTAILPHHNLRGHHTDSHHPQPPVDTQQQQQEEEEQEERGGQDMKELMDESSAPVLSSLGSSPPDSLSNPLENATSLPSLPGNSTDLDDSLLLLTSGDEALDPGQHMSVSTLLICVGFVALLFWCTLPRNNDDRARVLQRRRRERRERREREQQMKDEKYREVLIQKCLHIQKVLKAEGDELTLGQPDAEENRADTNDHDDNVNESGAAGRGSSAHQDEFGDESSMCIICLEPFQVGDVLAWSKGIPQQQQPLSPHSTDASAVTPSNSSNTSNASEAPHDEENPASAAEQNEENHVGPICSHVFHKECISSWLLNPKHDDCPACRSTIIKDLGDDATDGEGEMKRSDSEDTELDDDDEEEDGGLGNMAFVVAHGLVSQVRRASYSLIGSSMVDRIASHNDEEDDEEQFEDEHSSSGMEMVVTPTTVPCPPANVPPPFAMRRVASHEGRSSKPMQLRRRSSFTSEPRGPKETSIPPKPLLPFTPGTGSKSPFQLRRTLSAGTISRNSSEGSALLVKERPANKLPMPSSSVPRPNWSADAERELSQTLDDHRRSRISPLTARKTRARSLVSLESPGGNSGEFRKAFLKSANSNNINNASGVGGLPPLPLAKNASRQKSGYSLLDTTAVQHHEDD